MNNFLSITQHIIESNTGDSTGDMFKTACQVYEDEYGDITDAEAEEFMYDFLEQLDAFLEQLDTKEIASRQMTEQFESFQLIKRLRARFKETK